MTELLRRPVMTDESHRVTSFEIMVTAALLALVAVEWRTSGREPSENVRGEAPPDAG